MAHAADYVMDQLCDPFLELDCELTMPQLYGSNFCDSSRKSLKKSSYLAEYQASFGVYSISNPFPSSNLVLIPYSRCILPFSPGDRNDQLGRLYKP
jgi:hypothetical protein